MGLFSFLKSTPARIPADLSFIGVDMHSHLLPGLDDGSQNIEDSIRFIMGLHELGYRKFICTPHIISDMYPNSSETIHPAYEMVQARLAAENIPVEIAYAAEFMVNADFENLIKEGKLLLFGKNYVLIEMSYMAASPNIKDVIFELIMKGLQPVLAHPERYSYYHNKYNAIEDFVDAGCLLQVNILSLTGMYGKEVKRMAEALIEDKIISFAGTDLHHDRHLAMMKDLATNPVVINQLKGLNLLNNQL
ncbi:MAG: CpsB/CapC family capsule biosynthesis tyrosine phosphatase [Chitinophagaceae bacterium]